MNAHQTHETARGEPRFVVRRARDDRMIAGVCAGLSRTFGVAPVAVRLAAIVLAVVALPLALVAYAVLAVIVPREDGRALLGGEPSDRRETLIGWGLVTIAAITLITSVDDGFSFGGINSFNITVAIVIAIALAVIEARRRETPAASPTPPPAAVAPTPAAGAPRHESPYPTASSRVAGGATSSTAPTEPITRTQPLAQEEQIPTPPPPPPAPQRSRRRRPGPSLTLLGFAVLAIGVGVAVFLQVTDVVDISGRAAALLLAGGGIVGGAAAIAFARRRHAPGLLVLSLLLAGSGVAVGAVHHEIDKGIGQRTESPRTVAELADTFEYGIGQYVIDLRRVSFPPGETTVEAELGYGEILVKVPPNVRVVDLGDTFLSGTRLVNARVPEAIDAPTVRVFAHVDHGEARVEAR